MAEQTWEEEVVETHAKLATADGDPLDVDDEILDEEMDEEAPEGKAPDDEPEEAADKPPAKPDTEELLPPHTWPGEWKETFTKLPAESKKILLEMNQHMVNGFSQKMGQLGRMKRELDGLQKAVEPYSELLRRSGTSPELAVQRALAWEAHIQQHGAQGLLDFAKTRGIDLNEASQAGQQEYLTPTERQMQQELTSLRQAFQGTQQHIQQRDQMMQQRQQEIASQNAERMLLDFMNAKDPDGKLLHPHVERVASLMARLLQSGVVPDMESAYGMAATADPDIQAARERQRKAAQRKEQERKVEQVRKASKAGITSKSSGRKASTQSFEDEIEARLRKRTA